MQSSMADAAAEWVVDGGRCVWKGHGALLSSVNASLIGKFKSFPSPENPRCDQCRGIFGGNFFSQVMFKRLFRCSSAELFSISCYRHLQITLFSPAWRFCSIVGHYTESSLKHSKNRLPWVSAAGDFQSDFLPLSLQLTSYIKVSGWMGSKK